jgi:ParB family transcriptional regulator, chromosome partitioning protein
MLPAMAKPALGRGLGALLGGVISSPRTGITEPPLSNAPAAPAAPPGETVRMEPLSRVRPSPLQPRKEFNSEALRELADSIKAQGIMQPLIVRERDGLLELIAGERRWRAAQLAGLTAVPVLCREADDRTALELSLIENLQRENLNPMEEAAGYRQLIDQFQLTQDEAALKVGKSRVAVANSLRLLQLPAQVQAWVRGGQLSVGHAKVILGLAAGEQQTLAAQRVLKHSLTVRQAEDLVSHWLSRVATPAGVGQPALAPTPLRDAHVVALENKLRERLGTKVSLRYRQGKGAMEIRFFSHDELDRILEVLGIRVD